MRTKAGICEVHYYAMGDSRQRPVFWCPTCKAWICHECNRKPVARTVAATNRFIDNVLQKFK